MTRPRPVAIQHSKSKWHGLVKYPLDTHKGKMAEFRKRKFERKHNAYTYILCAIHNFDRDHQAKKYRQYKAAAKISS